MDNDQKLAKIRCEEHRIVSLQYKKSPKDEWKRKVQYDLIENKPTLIVTQEIKVRRSKVQYIVNLNTNLCDHKCKKRHRKSKRGTSEQKTRKRTEISANAAKERIVPVCMRQKCRHKVTVKTHELRLKCCRAHKGVQFTSPSSKSNKAVKQSHQEAPRKPTHHKKHHKIHRQKNRTLFSPISMSPLSDEKLHDISYEDISDDNFQSNSEDELDTLIKRTKERERNMVIQQIECKAFRPIRSPIKNSIENIDIIENEYFKVRTTNECNDETIDDNDYDTVFSSEMDVSIHSLATVILKTHSGAEAYSPMANPVEFEYSDERFQDNFHDIEESLSETVKQVPNPKRPKVETYSPAIRCREDREMMDNVKIIQEIQNPIKKEFDIDDYNDHMMADVEIIQEIQNPIKKELDIDHMMADVEIIQEIQNPIKKEFDIDDYNDHMMDDVEIIQEIQKPIKKEFDIDDYNDQCYVRREPKGNLRSENLNPSINTSQLQNMANLFVKPCIKDDFTNNCNNNFLKCSSSFTGYSDGDTFGDGFPIKREIKMEPVFKNV